MIWTVATIVARIWCVLAILGLGVMAYGFFFGKDVDDTGNPIKKG